METRTRYIHPVQVIIDKLKDEQDSPDFINHKDFADFYLAGNKIEPSFAFSHTNKIVEYKRGLTTKDELFAFLVKIREEYPLDSLARLNLKPLDSINIQVALHDLSFADQLAKTLKKLNTETIKKRKAAIEGLEKAKEYRYLSESSKKCIEEELSILLDELKQPQLVYSPMVDLKFSCLLVENEATKMANSLMLSGKRPDSIPPAIFSKIVEGTEKSINENEKQLKIALTREMDKKTGRPPEFFSKTLIKIIFGLLSASAKSFSVDRRKETTRNIINEYLEKYSVKIKQRDITIMFGHKGEGDYFHSCRYFIPVSNYLKEPEVKKITFSDIHNSI